jgi:hypothetical protein
LERTNGSSRERTVGKRIKCVNERSFDDGKIANAVFESFRIETPQPEERWGVEGEEIEAREIASTDDYFFFALSGRNGRMF